MKAYFAVTEYEGYPCLYNVKGIEGLISGDIFFHRKKDYIYVSTEYNFLDANYLNYVLDNFEKEVSHDFQILLDNSIEYIISENVGYQHKFDLIN